jgi:hypothetical protein
VKNASRRVFVLVNMRDSTTHPWPLLSEIVLNAAGAVWSVWRPSLVVRCDSRLYCTTGSGTGFADMTFDEASLCRHTRCTMQVFRVSRPLLLVSTAETGARTRISVAEISC